MLEIGNIRIHLLNDASVMVDGGGPFGLIPRSMWERVLPPDDRNMVPQSLTCLLVQVDGRNIVVDTGLGHKLDEKRRAIWRLERPHGDLLAGLARCGVQPEDVDTLILVGCTSSGCLRATTVDAYSYNNKVIIPEEAAFDRFQASHAMSLFDLNCKYADVIPSREVQDYLRGLPAPADAARE